MCRAAVAYELDHARLCVEVERGGHGFALRQFQNPEISCESVPIVSHRAARACGRRPLRCRDHPRRHPIGIAGDLRTVELGEIVAALADDYGEAAASIPARRWTRDRGEPSALGRNCMLFDLTRWWAYDRVERDADTIEGGWPGEGTDSRAQDGSE